MHSAVETPSCRTIHPSNRLFLIESKFGCTRIHGGDQFRVDLRMMRHGVATDVRVHLL
jgi:hypothetical protein